MYNKLFAKILDSSIWLEPTTTRIVWLTFIAAMDETGFVQFASIPNVASRARVPLAAAEKAIQCLESADLNSGDPENDGRRIERVPGGWMVLNAVKYRDIVTRAVHQANTRARVAKHRARQAGNAPVTLSNASVTPSEAETEARSETQDTAKSAVSSLAASLAGAHRSYGAGGNRRTNLLDNNLEHGQCGYAPSCTIGVCVKRDQHAEFSRRLSVSDSHGPDGRTLEQFYADTVAAWKAAARVPGGSCYTAWSTRFEAWLGAEAKPANTKGTRTMEAGRRLQAQLDAGAELDPFGTKRIAREMASEQAAIAAKAGA